MMPTPHWTCDICYRKFRTEEEAVLCEVRGRCEPPPWAAVGKTVYGFGETGVEGPALVRRVECLHDDVLVWTDRYMYLSHNEDPNEFEFVHNSRSLDPYLGWDFLRYVHYGDVQYIQEQARKWIRACREYGVAPDPTLAQPSPGSLVAGPFIEAVRGLLETE